jgi:hypothetical protein
MASALGAIVTVPYFTRCHSYRVLDPLLRLVKALPQCCLCPLSPITGLSTLCTLFSYIAAR